MKLYHGSTVTIDRIDLSKSRPNKDFGRGFYLSADRQQAQRMGEFKALTEGGTAVMNTFLSEKDFQYLKEQVTAKMIEILTEEQGMSLEEAIDKVYSSDLFQKLGNAETGLFFQSPRYLLSYL